MSKLSIDPFPGTLNLEISTIDDLENIKTLRRMDGIEIIPEDPSFCRGKCYLALMGGAGFGERLLSLMFQTIPTTK